MQAMEAINDALGSASPSVSGLSVGQSHGSYAMHIGVQEESRRTSSARPGLSEKVARVRPARDHLKRALTIHMCNSLVATYIHREAQRKRLVENPHKPVLPARLRALTAIIAARGNGSKKRVDSCRAADVLEARTALQQCGHASCYSSHAPTASISALGGCTCSASSADDGN